MKNRKTIDAMKHELQEMEAYKKVYQQYSLSRVDAHVKIEETKDNNVKEEIDDEKNGQETVSYRPNKFFFTFSPVPN